MTIQSVVDKIDALKPHQFGEDTIREWIADCEKKIHEEVISWHELPEQEEGEEAPELVVPDEYASVYLYYVQAQIDYWNAEMARYYNSMTMFNAALADFADWFNRRNMPKTVEITTTVDGL